MKKTFRRAVVFGLLALAAPFAALPLAKPATTDLQSTTPPPEVLPEPAASARFLLSSIAILIRQRRGSAGKQLYM